MRSNCLARRDLPLPWTRDRLRLRIRDWLRLRGWLRRRPFDWHQGRRRLWPARRHRLPYARQGRRCRALMCPCLLLAAYDKAKRHVLGVRSRKEVCFGFHGFSFSVAMHHPTVRQERMPDDEGITNLRVSHLRLCGNPLPGRKPSYHSIFLPL